MKLAAADTVIEESLLLDTGFVFYNRTRTASLTVGASGFSLLGNLADVGVAGSAGSSGTGTVAGGAGGAMARTGGAGGSATSTAGAAGGAGGAVTGTGGAGGSAAGTSAAGAGGAVTNTGGAGGAKTGTGTADGGAGGAVTGTGGSGGATASTNASSYGGVGGAAGLQGGAGGAASAGTANGGNGGGIPLQPGLGGASAGGTAGQAGIVYVATATTPVAATGAVSQAAATVTNGGTISTAQHRGQQVFQDASGGNVTMTTASATALAAALPNLPTGGFVMLYCASNHATNTSTLSAGAGVTLVGAASLTQTGATFLLRKTGASTFDLLRVG